MYALPDSANLRQPSRHGVHHRRDPASRATDRQARLRQAVDRARLHADIGDRREHEPEIGLSDRLAHLLRDELAEHRERAFPKHPRRFPQRRRWRAFVHQ